MENEIPQEEAQQNEISQQGEVTNPTDNQFYTLSINPIFGTNTSRSAYPAFSDTQLANYTFHAFCTNEFDEVQGEYNSTSGQVVFTIYSSGFTGKTIKFLVKNEEGVALWFAQKESARRSSRYEVGCHHHRQSGQRVWRRHRAGEKSRRV